MGVSGDDRGAKARARAKQAGRRASELHYRLEEIKRGGHVTEESARRALRAAWVAQQYADEARLNVARSFQASATAHQRAAAALDHAAAVGIGNDVDRRTRAIWHRAQREADRRAWAVSLDDVFVALVGYGAGKAETVSPLHGRGPLLSAPTSTGPLATGDELRVPARSER